MSHIELNISKTKLLTFLQKLTLPAVFPILVDAFKVLRSENLASFLTHLFFLPFLTPTIAENSLGSVFKIYPDSDHFSLLLVLPSYPQVIVISCLGYCNNFHSHLLTVYTQ